MTAAAGRLATVFGGTGFVGRRVVRQLGRKGFAVRVAVRRPDRAVRLLGDGPRGWTAFQADVDDEAAVAAAVTGAGVVVNAVGLYVERGGVTFERIHVEGARRVAHAAAEAGVGRLVHLSGIGSDPHAASDYVSARGRGEEAVAAAFPGVDLVRSAVMFGPDDALLTTVAGVVRRLPVYPLFGDGETRLRPAHVDDVAEGIARIAEGASADRGIREFAGPHAFTYAELVRHVATALGRRIRTAPVPFALWHLAARAAVRLPGSPLTPSQVELMRIDNLPSGRFPGLPDLGVAPTDVDAVLAALSRREEAG